MFMYLFIAISIKLFSSAKWYITNISTSSPSALDVKKFLACVAVVKWLGGQV